MTEISKVDFVSYSLKPGQLWKPKLLVHATAPDGIKIRFLKNVVFMIVSVTDKKDWPTDTDIKVKILSNQQLLEFRIIDLTEWLSCFRQMM